jgi:hypothetical protein
MRGSRSSDSAGAVSRSRGEGVDVVEVIEGTAGRDRCRSLDDLDDLDALCSLAESTSAI